VKNVILDIFIFACVIHFRKKVSDLQYVDEVYFYLKGYCPHY